MSFRNLCTHILARELTEPSIRKSLREGHVYVSHDWLCDPAGFTFGAGNNLGVFNLADTDGQSSVFGTDLDFRKNASPLFHVRGGAPPFLVTYCQWDYPTLPEEARQFHAALTSVGIPSDLVFIPRENHISEMVNVSKANATLARAVLDFVKSHSTR